MKKLTVSIILMIILFFPTKAISKENDNEKERQKFKVVFEIIYPAIDFEQAANLEKSLRQIVGTAGEINIRVKDNQEKEAGTIYYYNGSPLLDLDNEHGMKGVPN